MGECGVGGYQGGRLMAWPAADVCSAVAGALHWGTVAVEVRLEAHDGVLHDGGL